MKMSSLLGVISMFCILGSTVGCGDGRMPEGT